MPATILLVEDDVVLSEAVVRLLTPEYQPLVVHTAEEGLKLAGSIEPDLILLDVMVPNMGGWELCRRLRERTDVPIIFMTALTDTEEIVRGLRLGADDYITKPFDHDEFLARIEAHLRRFQPQSRQLAFDAGQLVIDLDQHTVFKRGEKVELTPREFSLLAVLAKNSGRVVSTKSLIEEAWGYSDNTENIKTYIYYLRRKLEDDPATPQWVVTVRGVGYRFAVN